MWLPAVVAAGQAAHQDVIVTSPMRAQIKPGQATLPVGRPVDVVLTNGSHVIGTIEGYGPDVVLVRTPNGVVRIPRIFVRSTVAPSPFRPRTSAVAPKRESHTADVSSPLLGLTLPQMPRVGAPAGLAFLGQHAVNQSLSFGVMPMLPLGIVAHVSYHARLTPTTTIGASIVHMESFFGRGGIASMTVTTRGPRSSVMAALNGLYGSGGDVQPAATGAFSRQLAEHVSMAGIGTISTRGGTILGLVGVGGRPMRANVGGMVTRTSTGQTFVRPIVMLGLRF
jgi:hypothetical protein